MWVWQTQLKDRLSIVVNNSASWSAQAGYWCTYTNCRCCLMLKDYINIIIWAVHLTVFFPFLSTASMWRFVLLGLAFICLLVGFMLLGMGSMANKYDLKLYNVNTWKYLILIILISQMKWFPVFFIQEQKGDSKVQSSSCCGSEAWRCGAAGHFTTQGWQQQPAAGMQTLPIQRGGEWAQSRKHSGHMERWQHLLFVLRSWSREGETGRGVSCWAWGWWGSEDGVKTSDYKYIVSNTISTCDHAPLE